MADRRKEKRGTDRRKTERLDQENEMTLSVISAGYNPPNRKIIYNVSKDISPHGAKIHSSVFLPVDSVLDIKFKSEPQNQFLETIGRVRWIKSLFADESFEMGLEFEYAPSEVI